MTTEPLLDRFLPPLLAGQRKECRDVLSEALNAGMEPVGVYKQMVWPAMERVAHLYRED